MYTTYINGSTNNQYIDSRIVWSSTPSTLDNSSKVTATLQYKRNNTGFTTSGTGSFSITIDGTKTSTSKSITITESGWVDAVSATKTVNHNDDGTKSITIEASGGIPKTTLSETYCSGTAKLDTIARGSTISYVSDVVLGNACIVRWTPYSRGFYYKIKFVVGSWTLTTLPIHPNTTTLYTNASYGISIDAAHQFPNSKDADMTVTLYTYSEYECTNQIGTASTVTCKVYIPESNDTLPTVKMNLAPVSSLSDNFKGLYIQNKTRVKASFEGSEAKYSASIKSKSMSVNGKTYSDQSDLLSTSGLITVKGTVEDSRGFSTSLPQDITVIPYSKPSLIPYNGETSIICKRCDSNGEISPSGNHLRIKAGRQYSKVLADGVQKNFCSIRFKYKVEGSDSWGSLNTILAKNNESDSVDAILTEVNLSVTTTYLVQIEIEDDIGESSSMIITIPTADVTVHLRKGGKAIGIGKYAEEDNIVDISEEWELYVRGNLNVNHINHIPAIDNYKDKDFNELIYKTGYYTGTAAPSAAGCSNYPDNETGLLEVISAMLQNKTTLNWWGFAYQTYRTHTGKVYMRTYFVDTGWTTWKKVTLT